ncbi:MAG: HAD family hydrolase [Erythrobacter sp.]
MEFIFGKAEHLVYKVKMERWAIFDADNTLWEVEPLYDQARRELCVLIEGRTKVSGNIIAEFQRRADAELHKTLGYDPQRFPASFLATAEYFLDENSLQDLSRSIRFLAQSVFKTIAPPTAGISNVLSKLKKTCKLGIITSGHEETQLRRLSQFPEIGRFSKNVMIVERKTPQSFTDFCKQFMVDIDRSWMIGDSLQSDVLPASQIGLQTIHYKTNSWHEIENDSHTLPDGTMQVFDLREVPAIVASAS